MTHTVRVKSFRIGDVEDPQFYVTNILLPEWFETPQGQFVKENAVEIKKYFWYDKYEHYYPVYIDAIFKDEKTLLEYHLKFENKQHTT